MMMSPSSRRGTSSSIGIGGRAALTMMMIALGRSSEATKSPSTRWVRTRSLVAVLGYQALGRPNVLLCPRRCIRAWPGCVRDCAYPSPVTPICAVC
jgi:hypothetical protein